jgi:hypothetical protein
MDRPEHLPLDWTGGFTIEPSPLGYALRVHHPGEPDEVCGPSSFNPVPIVGVPFPAETGAPLFIFHRGAR